MTKFNNILVATDFSVDGNNAVRRAALLAHTHSARLHILHVLKPAGIRPLREWLLPMINLDLKAALARAALRRVAVEITGAYDVKTKVEVQIGDPLIVLTKASEGADLVVLGRRGHRRLESLLVGRTVDRMLRISRRPVLIVKRPAVEPYRHLLMPMDFTSGSDAAVQTGAYLAVDARRHVIHATDSYVESMLRRAGVAEATIASVRTRAEAGVIARMRRSLGRLGADRNRTTFSVTRGPAHLVALESARALGVDLIVAGKNGQSTFGFMLGSVSSSVLEDADCDMLIVPRPRSAPPVAGAALAGPPADAPWLHKAPSFSAQKAS
ncbi:universal stress protein [Roseateles sp. P5_E8]